MYRLWEYNIYDNQFLNIEWIINLFLYFDKDVPHQDIMEKTVPYHAHKIVRKVTVTLWMEHVWAVLMDTRSQHVRKVSDSSVILSFI